MGIFHKWFEILIFPSNSREIGVLRHIAVLLSRRLECLLCERVWWVLKIVLLLKYNFRLFHLLLPPSTRDSALCALLHFIIRIISMISPKRVPSPRVLSSHNSNRKRIVKLLTVYARAMPPRNSQVFSSSRLFLFIFTSPCFFSSSRNRTQIYLSNVAIVISFRYLSSRCVLLSFSFSAHTDVSSRSSPMLMP